MIIRFELINLDLFGKTFSLLVFLSRFFFYFLIAVGPVPNAALNATTVYIIVATALVVIVIAVIAFVRVIKRNRSRNDVMQKEDSQQTCKKVLVEHYT